MVGAHNLLPPNARVDRYPPQLQASIMRWAETYHKFGGQDAFPHALRVLDQAVAHNMVELPKIGDRDTDTRGLNLRLANIILAHVFRRGKDNRKDFPTEDFERHRLVVDGFEVFDRLRENDLGAMSSQEYGRILQKPSLGTLARCIDIAQYGPDGITSEVELSHLDKRRFYHFDQKTGLSEYRHIAHVARMVYAPLADLLSYRTLAGDLMKMSYYHLAHDTYDKVRLLIQELNEQIAATQRLMTAMLPQLVAILTAQGYTFEIRERPLKHIGKVMEKVDRYSRKDGGSIEDHIKELHDLVAFTVILDSKNGRTITQNDLEDYRNVATIIVGLVSTYAPLRYKGRYDHLYTDMISKPKASGYQSYHADMEFNSDQFVWLEAIVRNRTMELYASKGGAAHHLFKGGRGLTKVIERAYNNVKRAIESGMNPADLDVTPVNHQVVFQVPGRERYTKIIPGGACIAEALICGGISLSDRYAISPARSLLDPVEGTIRIELVRTAEPMVAVRSTLRQILPFFQQQTNARKANELFVETRSR
ncbi:MAG: hypothetical protein ABID61_03030 [Candidatus Micrarchaeota archaeon]